MSGRTTGRGALDENLDDGQIPGRHGRAASRLRHPAGLAAGSPWRRPRRPRRHPARVRPGTRLLRVAAITTAVIAMSAAGLAFGLYRGPGGPAAPASAGRYIGVFTPGVPQSYTGVSSFASATGARPSVVVYYSGWLEPFQARFAATVARHGAVPLVQIDPTGISLAAIAAGRYDGYLRSYAAAVNAFGGRVILSFGHEMNGDWYSWGHRHTSPAVFVAAWRHVVTVFRAAGARHVTWLWTVNIIRKGGFVPPPAPWWPGNAYVNWVGVDGYYFEPSWTFASLFGPVIKAVRALTLDPILISETSAVPAARQAAKVADLFAGVRAYGLLGFVWFNADGLRDWRLSGPAAFAAFRRSARTLDRPSS